MGVSDTVKALEVLAKVPINYLVGSTKDRVVYLSNEGGMYTLWSLDTSNGSRHRVTNGPVALPEHVALPRHDTNNVFYIKDTAKGRELHLLYRADSVRGDESVAVDMSPMRIEGLGMWGGEVAFTGSTKDEIAIYAAKSGRIERRAKFDTYAFVTDFNGAFIVGAGTLAKNPRSQELFIFDTATGGLNQFTPRPGSVNKPAFLNGPKVLFESDCTGKNELHVHNIETGETERVPMGSQDHDSYGAIEHQYYGWTDAGKVWCIGKREGEARAFVDGKEIPTPRGFLWGLAMSGGRVYVAHTTVAQPIRILEIEPESGRSKVILDNPLPEDLGAKLGSGHFIRFVSFDGREIPALVVDDGTGTPRRTVTLVHGGPWGEYLNSWGPIINSVVLGGYNVIAPNYRGSTGYGEEFRTLDIGDPGGGDLQDIAASARWALKNGIATEVAIVGYSYGGYSTLLALGKEPELWACGVAGAPIADWKQMYELSDAVYRQFAEVLFGQKLELFDERSPITYVKNVTRPVCILSSQNDSRTPLPPVLRYVTNLQDQGGTFELHVVPDMGHLMVTTQDMMDIVYPMVAFLHKRFPPTEKS